MKEIVIHVRDKGGERFHKLALGTRVLTIGRAWGNDVVLQDKYVSPEHFSISLSDGGVLLLTDLASTNGTSIKGRSMHGEAVPYQLGSAVRVGDTSIRIVDPASGVEPALIRSGWFLLAEKFRTFPAIVLLSALALALVVTLNWLFSVTEFGRSDALSVAFTTLIVMIVWTLLLGFAGKLIRGEGNFRALWILACLGILLFGVIDVVVRIVRFNLQDAVLGKGTSTVLLTAVCVLVLVGVFTYISHLSRFHKWLWSLLIVLSVLGLANSDDLLKQDHERWSGESRIDTITLPGAFVFRDAVTVDDYQRATEDLFEFENID